jgi:hypothetical protein
MDFSTSMSLREAMENLSKFLKGDREIVKNETPEGETTWRIRAVSR